MQLCSGYITSTYICSALSLSASVLDAAAAANACDTHTQNYTRHFEGLLTRQSSYRIFPISRKKSGADRYDIPPRLLLTHYACGTACRHYSNCCVSVNAPARQYCCLCVVLLIIVWFYFIQSVSRSNTELRFD